MIVCLCRRVSDRDIAHAVQAGIRCFDVLQDDTGVASSCGCCHECAREVFETAVERYAPAVSAEQKAVTWITAQA